MIFFLSFYTINYFSQVAHFRLLTLSPNEWSRNFTLVNSIDLSN